MVLDSKPSLIHSAKRDRSAVDVPEPVADLLAQTRQRRGEISRPVRFPQRLSTTLRGQVAESCWKASLRHAATLWRVCTGRDRFRGLRLPVRATTGHLPPVPRTVHGPCYKQVCRTISSLP